MIVDWIFFLPFITVNIGFEQCTRVEYQLYIYIDIVCEEEHTCVFILRSEIMYH